MAVMPPGDDILLLHLTGDDRPGLTASLTGVLARHGVAVLDLNQSVSHRSLLLGLMVRLPSADRPTVMAELSDAARAAGLALRVTPIADADYDPLGFARTDDATPSSGDEDFDAALAELLDEAERPQENGPDITDEGGPGPTR